MAFYPFTNNIIGPATISGALTVTGQLTTQGGIAASGGPITQAGNLSTSALGVITASGGVNTGVGGVDVPTAGQGLAVKEGSNARQGRSTLVAGAVTVANTSTVAGDEIMLTSQADGGTPGFVRVSARTAGTSFTITSGSGTDTSSVGWEMMGVG